MAVNPCRDKSQQHRRDRHSEHSGNADERARVELARHGHAEAEIKRNEIVGVRPKKAARPPSRKRPKRTHQRRRADASAASRAAHRASWSAPPRVRPVRAGAWPKGSKTAPAALPRLFPAGRAARRVRRAVSRHCHTDEARSRDASALSARGGTAPHPRIEPCGCESRCLRSGILRLQRL